METLAINGGTPIRTTRLQYGKQTIEKVDIDAVVDVLNENTCLTTGPRVLLFEKALAKVGNMAHAVAVSNGTAALHCAVEALGIGPGDEVIVCTMSFVASSNCVLYQGATPVLADIDPNTMNLDVGKVVDLITKRTKAIVTVDFAGQPCDMVRLRHIADRHGLYIVEDAAHAVGSSTSIADLVTYSFHPVKNIPTGEGGAILTNCPKLYERMLRFRCHGIDTDYSKRKLHHHDVISLGYNYRLTEIQCALGLSQLARLDAWVARRRAIAAGYDRAFGSLNKWIVPLQQRHFSAYHIYVVCLRLDRLTASRDEVFAALQAEGLGVNVHYKPIHMQTLYSTLRAECPVAESVYDTIITLPLFPTMTEDDTHDVIAAVTKVIRVYSK